MAIFERSLGPNMKAQDKTIVFNRENKTADRNGDEKGEGAKSRDKPQGAPLINAIPHEFGVSNTHDCPFATRAQNSD